MSDKHSISRRGALGRMAVAAAAGVAAPAIPGVAHAATALKEDGLRSFKGLYALRNGRVIDGYFVAPRNQTRLDVVVVLHGENGFDAKARALAHRYARAGKLAIVPDMAASYTGIEALSGRDARVADIRKLAPAFANSMHANGNIEYVSA